MQKNNAKFYIFAALCTLLPLLIGITVIGSALLQIFYAAGIAFLYIRRGAAAALSSVAAGFALAIAVLGDPSAILISVGAVLLGILIGIGARRRMRFSQIFVGGTIVFIAPIIALIAYANYFYGPNFINDYVNEIFGQISSSLHATLQMAGDVPPAFGSQRVTPSDIDNMIITLKTAFLTVIPAIIVVFGMASSFISIMCAKWFVLWDKGSAGAVPSFAFLRLNKATTVAMLISALLITFNLNNQIAAAFINIVIILAAVSIICGLSIVDFYLRQRVPPRIVRVIMYMGTLTVFMFLSDMLLVILSAMGLIDSFIKLRIVFTSIGEGQDGQ